MVIDWGMEPPFFFLFFYKQWKQWLKVVELFSLLSILASTSFESNFILEFLCWFGVGVGQWHVGFAYIFSNYCFAGSILGKVLLWRCTFRRKNKMVRCTVFREFTNDNFKNSDEVQKTTLQILIDIYIMKNNSSGLELSLGGIQTTFPE